MNNTENIEISLIILCYKSGKEIEHIYATYKDLLISMDVSYEIILIGNDYNISSSDVTYQTLEEIRRNNNNTITVLLEKSGGMGWDLKSGLLLARGNYICFIDGDGQVQPETVSMLYNTIVNEKADIGLSYRSKRYDGIYRKTISVIFNLISNLLLWRKTNLILDINAKPKILKNGAIPDFEILANDWFIDADIVIRAIENKLKIIQVPTFFYRNEHRDSFVGTATIIEFLKNLLTYKIRNER